VKRISCIDDTIFRDVPHSFLRRDDSALGHRMVAMPSGGVFPEARAARRFEGRVAICSLTVATKRKRS
jgi:hypothetical protein